VVEIFHRKPSNSALSSSKIYPSGNLSGLFLTEVREIIKTYDGKGLF